MSAESFERLVAPHRQAMLRFAAALIGMSDAEDAAQEAVTRAWEAWATLRDPGAVGVWLLRITYGVCRDWRRGRFGTRLARTQPLPEQGADDDGAAHLAYLEPGPGASEHAAALDLRAAVSRLEPPLRVVVALRYYAGMDATAIGAALDIPPATVRTRLRRALELLRVELRPSGEQRIAKRK